MNNNIKPELKVISNYLTLENKETFIIPEYQRAYSWDIEQCDKLWEDIDNFIQDKKDNKKHYFFGTIIIDCSSGNQKQLIDGQQRTTTFFLLLKAMLFVLDETIHKVVDADERQKMVRRKEKLIKLLFKATDDTIDDFLEEGYASHHTDIITNKSINECYKEEFKTIMKASDLSDATNNVTKIKYKQKDNRYTHYFRNCKFFYEKLKDANINIVQLVDGFLKKCQVIEIKTWDMGQAIAMFNSLNSTGMPLSDADIISAYAYKNIDDTNEFNAKWEEIIYYAKQLESEIKIDLDAILQQYMYIHRGIKNNSGAAVSLRSYYLDDEELVKKPTELCNHLLKIIALWEVAQRYHIVKVMLKCNHNIKYYLASFLYRYNNIQDFNEQEFLDFCEILLRQFILLEIVEAGYSDTRFKTFLFKENIKFVDSKISLQEIIDDFDNHITKNWKREDIIDVIKCYNKSKKTLVYVNEYLYNKEKGNEFILYSECDVEHIMPSSGGNLDSIRKDANISDKEEFDDIVDKLGNKILLESAINRNIGNDWFRTKQNKYKDSQYAIAKSLSNYNQSWTKEDIEKATDKVAKRITRFIFG